MSQNESKNFQKKTLRPKFHLGVFAKELRRDKAWLSGLAVLFGFRASFFFLGLGRSGAFFFGCQEDGFEVGWFTLLMCFCLFVWGLGYCCTVLRWKKGSVCVWMCVLFGPLVFV